MDNYIYFRVLDYLIKLQKATLSELILSSGLNWKDSPVIFLYTNGFLEKALGTYKYSTYFVLSSSGRLLYYKMKIFYDNFYDALSIVDTKLRTRRDKRKNVFQK